MIPIATYKITGGTSSDIEDYTLTLKFRLRNQGKLDCAELAEALQNVMRDWDEGRYPFDAEMVSAGLERCLKHAVSSIVTRKAQAEFGHEMVRHAGGSGSTAKWYLEARKRSVARKQPWIISEPVVEIT